MSSYAKVDVHILYKMCNNYIEYYDKLRIDLLNSRLDEDKKQELRYKIMDLGGVDIKEIYNVIHLCYFVLNNNKMGPLVENITISDNIARILNDFQQEIDRKEIV